MRIRETKLKFALLIAVCAGCGALKNQKASPDTPSQKTTDPNSGTGPSSASKDPSTQNPSAKASPTVVPVQTAQSLETPDNSASLPPFYVYPFNAELIRRRPLADKDLSDAQFCAQQPRGSLWYEPANYRLGSATLCSHSNEKFSYSPLVLPLTTDSQVQRFVGAVRMKNLAPFGFNGDQNTTTSSPIYLKAEVVSGPTKKLNVSIFPTPSAWNVYNTSLSLADSDLTVGEHIFGGKPFTLVVSPAHEYKIKLKFKDIDVQELPLTNANTGASKLGPSMAATSQSDVVLVSNSIETAPTSLENACADNSKAFGEAVRQIKNGIKYPILCLGEWAEKTLLNYLFLVNSQESGLKIATFKVTRGEAVLPIVIFTFPNNLVGQSGSRLFAFQSPYAQQKFDFGYQVGDGAGANRLHGMKFEWDGATPNSIKIRFDDNSTTDVPLIATNW